MHKMQTLVIIPSPVMVRSLILNLLRPYRAGLVGDDFNPRALPWAIASDLSGHLRVIDFALKAQRILYF